MSGSEEELKNSVKEPAQINSMEEPAPVNSMDEPAETEKEDSVPSDDEDDCEGYFLEPSGNNVNIADKIAEANKKLLEEEEGDENIRPRKVQFSEELINYEPAEYSDEEYVESVQNSVISEEDVELKLNIEEKEASKGEHESIKLGLEEPPILASESEESRENKSEEDIEEIVEELSTILPCKASDTISEELTDDYSNEGNKLLLILFPKEQNSSCESIIGEEITGQKTEEKEVQPEPEKAIKTKIARPKSANNSKHKKFFQVSKISPNLNDFPSVEKRTWEKSKKSSIRSKNRGEEKKEKSVDGGEMKVKITNRGIKKINIDDLSLEASKQGGELKRCCDNRPKSSYDVWKGKGLREGRPKTAPLKRNCFVIRGELPQYKGLRSEYGLSAEQLQERKQRTLEIKHQRKQNEMKIRQEELKKRNENEETFQRWLFNKCKKSLKKKPIRVIDTLTRSDVYIQTHASYAGKRSVPYSVDYSLNRKISGKETETIERKRKRNKTIVVSRYLEKVSPHFKKSFNIYLGVRQ